LKFLVNGFEAIALMCYLSKLCKENKS